jgi:glycosyltransferase involved in cell wall biosynthesis
MARIIILENTFYTVLSLRMEILCCLRENGYEVIILSTGPSEDFEKLSSLGFHCIDVGSVILNPIKALAFILALMRNIRKISPLAICSFTIRPNIFGSIVARVLRIPIISNVTGTGPLTESNSMVYKIIRLLYKFAFSKNKTVFFQNEDDMHFFLHNSYVSSSQAKLLPGSGVDTDHYAPREKTESNFSFLLISRLIRDKGVMEFAHAAEVVKKSHPEIDFKILGPFWTQSIGKNTLTMGDLDPYIQNDIVNYLGYTLDVRPYIAEADCIVLPSYREGCANVLMQAASMSKPLIATDVTGCRNLINDQDSGYICKVKSTDDLAEKLIKMYSISAEKRKNMGQNGREKMIKEYQKKIVFEAYLNEIKSIA